MANVLHFPCGNRARTILKGQDVLVEIFRTVDVMSDFAQTLRAIRGRVLQRADAETLSEQIPFVEGSFQCISTV